MYRLTFTPTTRTAGIDMGASNTYRYVTTTSVPNSNSTTYTYPANSTGGTTDMGESNSYRYVNASNVYNKGVSDGGSGKITPSGTITISSNGSHSVYWYSTASVNVNRVLWAWHSGRSVKICTSKSTSSAILTFSADNTEEWRTFWAM